MGFKIREKLFVYLSLPTYLPVVFPVLIISALNIRYFCFHIYILSKMQDAFCSMGRHRE